MRVQVDVKLKQSISCIKFIEVLHYEARIHSAPVNNKANEEIQRLLAKEFHTAKANIVLVSGKQSRHKIFEIIQT